MKRAGEISARHADIADKGVASAHERNRGGVAAVSNHHQNKAAVACREIYVGDNKRNHREFSLNVLCATFLMP